MARYVALLMVLALSAADLLAGSAAGVPSTVGDYADKGSAGGANDDLNGFEAALEELDLADSSSSGGGSGGDDAGLGWDHERNVDVAAGGDGGGGADWSNSDVGAETSGGTGAHNDFLAELEAMGALEDANSSGVGSDDYSGDVDAGGDSARTKWVGEHDAEMVAGGGGSGGTGWGDGGSGAHMGGGGSADTESAELELMPAFTRADEVGAEGAAHSTTIASIGDEAAGVAFASATVPQGYKHDMFDMEDYEEEQGVARLQRGRQDGGAEGGFEARGGELQQRDAAEAGGGEWGGPGGAPSSNGGLDTDEAGSDFLDTEEELSAGGGKSRAGELPAAHALALRQKSIARRALERKSGQRRYSAGTSRSRRKVPARSAATEQY